MDSASAGDGDDCGGSEVSVPCSGAYDCACTMGESESVVFAHGYAVDVAAAILCHEG